ncbi:Cof-type HAD-IIB family hydrolase [Bacilliculturomica massiliensis]|uniref:Cof-type HAD-IIB family hydrolase n=1 Tax=Bacilliculturomica massiliensis TaxID=1917867 RepID=UPI0013EF0DEB|nr:HAD family hydrolase [Bacilliculturomica massiliensis]
MKRAERKKPRGEETDIKLIALDMDGTLLNEQGVLSEKSRRTLERAMEKGVHVVIATGRVYSALPRDVVEVPGIEYAITSNGANLLRLADMTTLYSNLLERESVEKIMHIMEDPSIMTEVFFDHGVYAERRCLSNLEEFGIVTEKSKRYTLSTREPVDSVLELIRSNETRLENINLIFKDMEKRRQVWNELEQLGDITVTSSMPYNLELGGATTSKADALAHLAGILGVEREQIMACGDSVNDLAMLNFAGFSVAMENGAEPVRKAADFITKSNGEDGVAYAIETFALKER